jgi:uncharacterized membrane protein HdeD (DUF308 family)
MPAAPARRTLTGDHQTHQPPEVFVIILGLILLLIGLFAKISILTTIGIILVVVGLVLVLLGSTGRAVGGRKHFF